MKISSLKYITLVIVMGLGVQLSTSSESGVSFDFTDFTYNGYFTFEEVPTVLASNRLSMTSWEYESLVRLAYAEGGINGSKGVKMIVWAIERRLQHPSWSNLSIFEVVSQPGQFNGYQSEHYNRKEIPKNIYRWVDEALTQPNIIPPGYVYFWNPDASSCKWFKNNISLPQQDKKIVYMDHEFFPDPNL